MPITAQISGCDSFVSKLRSAIVMWSRDVSVGSQLSLNVFLRSLKVFSLLMVLLAYSSHLELNIPHVLV